jgi:hemoglobin-like flavoprotein
MNFEKTFDQSYERVKAVEVDGKTFFDAFYENFKRSSPTIRQAFKDTDMVRQREMLEKSFYSLFIFYATCNENDYLEKIAHRHAKHDADVNPELYDDWLDCLLKTVKEFDPDYSRDVDLSWRLILSAGITYMKFHYHNPVPEK